MLKGVRRFDGAEHVGDAVEVINHACPFTAVITNVRLVTSRLRSGDLYRRIAGEHEANNAS